MDRVLDKFHSSIRILDSDTDKEKMEAENCDFAREEREEIVNNSEVSGRNSSTGEGDTLPLDYNQDNQIELDEEGDQVLLEGGISEEIPSIWEPPQLLPISRILPNPYQLRSSNEKDIEELTNSVRAYGILEPLLVSRKGIRKYYLIAGHRRLEAAKRVGLRYVPCIVLNHSDKDYLTISLIENLQRADLNPWEEAKALKMLVESGLNYREISKRIGKSIGYISERVAFLDLPDDLVNVVLSGQLPIRKALILGKIPLEKVRAKYAQRAVHLSVEELRALVEEEFARRQNRTGRMRFHQEYPKGLREFSRNNSQIKLFRGRISIKFENFTNLRSILQEIIKHLESEATTEDNSRL